MLWPSYLKIRLVYFNKTLLMKRKLCDFYAVEYYLFLTKVIKSGYNLGYLSLVVLLVYCVYVLLLQIMGCSLLYRSIDKMVISSQSHVIQQHCRACLRRSYCTSPSVLRRGVRVRFAPSPTGRPLAKHCNNIYLGDCKARFQCMHVSSLLVSFLCFF